MSRLPSRRVGSVGVMRKASRAPFLAHAAVLLVLLLALVPVVGWNDVVTADEGAMLAQLEILDTTGEWTAENPEPAVDPGAESLPLEKSDRTADGRWAPFVKHPVHILLLRPVYAVAGTLGVVVMSVVATVVAALFAALLARRIDRGLAVPTLWLAGVGSPLLFDGYLVLGHALGAACFGAAALAAVRFAAATTVAGRAVAAFASVAAVALTGLVRAEGVLAGLALGAGIAIVGLLRRRAASIALGAAFVAAAGLVRVFEPRLAEALLGGPSLGDASIGELNTGGFLEQRWSGFELTMLRTAYVIDPPDLALLIGVVLGLVAVVYVRLGRDDRLVRALAVGAAALVCLRLLEWGSFVPGLLMACPAILLGAFGVRRAVAERDPVPFLGVTSVVFVVAVAMTQYDVGGSGEWGGRYFAVVLPLLVPIATALLADIGGRASTGSRRVLGAGFLVATIALGALSVGAVRDARTGAGQVADAVVAAAGPAEDRIVVTTHGATARFAWRSIDEGRWFSVPSARLGALSEQLRDTGAGRITLVTRAPEEDLAAVAPIWRVDRSEPLPGWVIATLTPR